MIRSVDARVLVAQSFINGVFSARDFMAAQDAATGARRFEQLLAQIRTVRERLRRNPGIGRPARFLESRSIQSEAAAARVLALAEAHGMPHLRELVIKPYVLLHAHADDRVLLLALKHERELAFKLG